jgi:hypothetical protein
LPAEVVTKTQGKIVVQYPSNSRLLLAYNEDTISTLANLLSFFSETEIEDSTPRERRGKFDHDSRSTTSPRYITEALSAIIRATQPHNNPAPTIFINKRLDDRVLSQSIRNAPWRRSPIWLILRVSIQSTLLEHGLEKEYGYKAFQAFLMANLLQSSISLDHAFLTNDLLHFMNAKLARRLAKLGNSVQYSSKLPLDVARSTVQKVASHLKKRWEEIQTEWENCVQWTKFESENFENFSKLTFSNSQNYLQKVINRQEQLEQRHEVFDKVAGEQRLFSTCVPRASLSSKSLPSINFQKATNSSLFDFELWVQLHLQSWIDSPSRSEQDCQALFKILSQYRMVASNHYKGDPEALSLMYLCILELWVVLDRLVTGWCNLLLEYSPEIPASILDPLLLPYVNHVERLQRVQHYIQGRHQHARKRHSILSDINSPHSFQNKYFSLPLASSLKKLHEDIRKWASVRREDKIKELNQLNDRYNSLIEEAGYLQCTNTELVDPNGDKFQSHLPKKCKKCQLKDEATGLKISVIEDPLPNALKRAQPIVFELNCPKPFSLWRDATVLVLRTTCSEKDERSYSTRHPLSQYEPACKFFSRPHEDPQVSLISSELPIASRYYQCSSSLPAKEQDVILKNVGNFSLYIVGGFQYREHESQDYLRKQCSFQLEGPYKVLQDFLQSTSHTSNEVIASQHQCPTDLSIDEYLAFGHIRAGNRIQWCNIIRTMRSKNLSLSEPNVYRLIVQSIWQAGPLGKGELYREAHADLMDETICHWVLSELQATLQQLEDNWTQLFHLASAVAIALRIHNFNQLETIRCRAIDVLTEARNIAFRWISILKEPPKSQAPTSVHSKHALIGSSFILRATFDVELDDYSVLFRTNEDIIRYLYAGTFTSDLALDTLPTEIHLLARRDRRMSLKLRPHVSSMCDQDTRILDGVISLRWSDYRPGGKWTPLPSPAERWWSSSTESCTRLASRVVYLNIIDGTLLINGRGYDRLPSNYTTHKTFATLFKRDVSFLCLAMVHIFIYFRKFNMFNLQE